MEMLQINGLGTLPYGPEEALNRLRVNLSFCGSDFKTILITSSTPEEGKSFISANLWRMLAESGKRVCLVDADLRKSVLKTRYGIKSGAAYEQPGISHFLSGQAAISDVVYQTNIENAYIVPTFRTISNPAILLQSERFPQLLETLAKSFDYVLVDTPPLGSVADGELIASQCDGALLVVRGSFTSRKLVSESLKIIDRSGCKLLGVVMNRVQSAGNRYYYKSKYGKYYSSYGYGYGYGNSESDKKK